VAARTRTGDRPRAATRIDNDAARKLHEAEAELAAVKLQHARQAAMVQASQVQLNVNDAMHTVAVSQLERRQLAVSQLSTLVDIAKEEMGKLAVGQLSG
jgi:ribosomal protein S4E